MKQEELDTKKLIFFLVCNMVGSGIFVAPKTVYNLTNSILGSLLCWAIAGLLALILGIGYSKLGNKYPEGNGDPYYLTILYSSKLAIIYTIFSIIIILPCGCSIMIKMITNEFKNLLPNRYSEFVLTFIPIFLSAFFCFLNGFDWISFRLQYILTILKVFFITILLIIIIQNGRNTIPYTSKLGFTDLLTGIGTCIWCFDGWNSGNFITTKIKNVKKSLYPSIMISIVFVTLLYLIINLSFLRSLPEFIFKNDNNIVSTYFENYIQKKSSVIGIIFTRILPFLIIVIPSLGTLNGSFIVSKSIISYYFNNSYVYLSFFTILVYILTFIRSVESLIKIVGFNVLIFYGLCVVKIGVVGVIGFLGCLCLVVNFIFGSLF